MLYSGYFYTQDSYMYSFQITTDIVFPFYRDTRGTGIQIHEVNT